jgi:hypothetical protein
MEESFTRKAYMAHYYEGFTLKSNHQDHQRVALVSSRHSSIVVVDLLIAGEEAIVAAAAAAADSVAVAVGPVPETWPVPSCRKSRYERPLAEVRVDQLQNPTGTLRTLELPEGVANRMNWNSLAEKALQRYPNDRQNPPTMCARQEVGEEVRLAGRAQRKVGRNRHHRHLPLLPY